MILLAAPIGLWLACDPWLRFGGSVGGGAGRAGLRIKEGLERVVAFAAGILLVVAPVAWRNYHVSGELVPLTAGGGKKGN